VHAISDDADIGSKVIQLRGCHVTGYVVSRLHVGTS